MSYHILKAVFYKYLSGASYTDVDLTRHLSQTVRIRIEDYPFRPHALKDFPLYFFMAGCEATHRLNSDSMMWMSLPREDGQGAALRQASYRQDPIMSKTFPHRPLIDSAGEPLHKYGYYVRLKTHGSWKVPVLYGRSPAVPDDNASAAEKANYAFYLMLLFRPYRHIDDLIRDIFGNADVRGSMEAAQRLVYDFFLKFNVIYNYNIFNI